MSRTQVLLPFRAAQLVRRCKVQLSDDLGRMVTMPETIETVCAQWLAARGQLSPRQPPAPPALAPPAVQRGTVQPGDLARQAQRAYLDRAAGRAARAQEHDDMIPAQPWAGEGDPAQDEGQ